MRNDVYCEITFGTYIQNILFKPFKQFNETVQDVQIVQPLRSVQNVYKPTASNSLCTMNAGLKRLPLEVWHLLRASRISLMPKPHTAGRPKEVLDFTMEGSIKPLVPTVGTAFLNALLRLILNGAAYETGVYSYQEIAKEFGVHFNTVGRIVR